MSADRLGIDALMASMRAYDELLAAQREVLNRLNVYPVPDGDTGTNMQLTVEAALRTVAERLGEELAGIPAAAVADALSYGALMGARGNSGVILCQVLRAVAQGVAAEPEGIDAEQVAELLNAASDAARAAVLKPTEGTILTVAATAAEAAHHEAKDGGGIAAVLEVARDAARDGLWRTPQLLPVLAEAGVVDAGGAGLLLLFEALFATVAGRPLPEKLDLPAPVAALVADTRAPRISDAPVMAEDGVGALRYEVMYFLEAPEETIAAFKLAWSAIGDSIVVVGGDGLWNCHVHTDDIGAAIEAALDVGRPRQIRVTDLSEQVEEEQWVRAGAKESEPVAPVGPPPRTSIVAVAMGEGVERIFRSLGVSHLVAGGQSMNPSTAEILAVVEATPGAEVVVLPNNSNIIPVISQVAAVSSKPVRVVPTKGIQEGFAALLEYDPAGSADDNAESMATAARRVVAGEVTKAVRNAETPAGTVQAGEFIGLSRQGVEVRGASADEAVKALIERLLRPEHEIVTLIEGAGSSAAQTRRVTEWMKTEHPKVTVEQHRGGQPLYPYLISIE